MNRLTRWFKRPATQELAAAAPRLERQYVAQSEAQYLVATTISRMEANVGALVRRFEEHVGNQDKLNRALGDFREKLVIPLAEELKHLRYGMGAKVEQTTTELAGIVNHLDKALTAIFKAQGWSDEQISAYKTQYGLDSISAPRAAEFAAYAERIAGLREEYEKLLAQNALLIEQNQRLAAEIERLNGAGAVPTPQGDHCVEKPC